MLPEEDGNRVASPVLLDALCKLLSEKSTIIIAGFCWLCFAANKTSDLNSACGRTSTSNGSE